MLSRKTSIYKNFCQKHFVEVFFIILYGNKSFISIEIVQIFTLTNVIPIAWIEQEKSNLAAK